MNMFGLWIQCNIYLLLPMVVIGLGMSFLCMHSERMIRRIWGWSGIVVTGMIGTPIHECSHLFMALLFGYKIVDVKLFCPVAGKKTGILGYVTYKYRKNLLCRIGNFFVGIAPMLGGSLVIWFLFQLLLPDMAAGLKNVSIPNSYEAFQGFWQNMELMLQGIEGHVGHLIIFLILLIAVSLHMSISKADLKGAAYGVVFLEIVLVVLSVAASIANWNGVYRIFEMVTGFLWLSLSIGLAAACFTCLMISLIASIVRK